MKKKLLGVILVLVLIIAAIPLSSVFASDGYNLIATGVQGTEDRIMIDLPEGTTLGQLQSISWQEWLVAGYPPHIDIRLDLNGNGVYDSGVDDVLAVEYAYNTPTHYEEGQITGDTSYGALAGAWYATFADDGNGPATVSDSSIAWLASQAPGPYTGNQVVDASAGFWWATIADWKAGNIDTSSLGKTIDGNTEVLYLEIEVDNWIINTTAMIKDISVDFGGASASLSATVASPPQVVSVVLDLGSINFGTVYQGASSTKTVRVTNGGNTAISVTTAVLVGEISPFNHMTVTPSSFDIPVGGYQDVELVLTIPSDFAVGNYSSAGALTFTATAQ